MPRTTDRPARDEDRYRGFSLQQVCWGYRDLFARSIDRLFERGLIGPGREAVSAAFFELLGCANRRGFDDAVKEFLAALHERTWWLMDRPGLFADVIDVGRTLAAAKPYYGIGFFRIMGEEGFGATPARVRDMLTWARRLIERDAELAFAFVRGYRTLARRLSPDELGRYVQQGLLVHARSRSRGLDFMAATARSTEHAIRAITQECRLDDVRGLLRALVRALGGRDVEVADLGALDADRLIERNTRAVCLRGGLFLPARVRFFGSAAQNRDWYLLCALTAAAMQAMESFPSLHGEDGCRDASELATSEPLALNLFCTVEYVRAVRWIRARWPGARSLLDFGLRTQFERVPVRNTADALLRDALGPEAKRSEAGRAVVEWARTLRSARETAARAAGCEADTFRRTCPGLAACLIQPFEFFPDFLYTCELSVRARPPRADDLGKRTDLPRAPRHEAQDASAVRMDESRAPPDRGETEREAPSACFAYDEWDHEENDYLRDHCMLFERRLPRPPPRGSQGSETGVSGPRSAEAGGPVFPEGQVRRVRRVFELFRPDDARREKYLSDGDVINHDLLVEHRVDLRREPASPARFYEKLRLRERDLAVLLLLDVSISTNTALASERVIEIEKRAALLLGHGLASLGDRFAVCGFSGEGPERCEYFVYKDFAEPWDAAATARVWAAAPTSSTRMGVAVRHSARRLADLDVRRRLVLLITDGQPMDRDYSPQTRYAQHDVRMACEEARRRGIHTFCFSTEKNSRPDLELMFPRGRFAVVRDIRQLAHRLPRMYLGLTT